MKVLVLTADANTLIYHRGDLLRDLAAAGCEVVTSAAEDYPHVQEYVRALGGRHEPIRMVRSRITLRHDWRTWVDMFRLFRRERPDILFAYTIKSVVYGCLIARLAGVPRVHALLPGLGFTFVPAQSLRGRFVQLVSRLLHRAALTQADVIYMQNQDDVRLFQELQLLPPGTPVHVTAGSGVNLQQYPPTPLPPGPPLHFGLVSRLLISKGVAVFAEAARRVKARYPDTQFHLIGPFDPNPNRVPEAWVEGWVREGLLTHHGMVRDVAPLLEKLHVFVLPTWYREGVPHATLEALAMGRVILTTDSVGARECVVLTETGEKQHAAGQAVMQGTNGHLVRPQDVTALEQAMLQCLENPHQLAAMGRASSDLAQRVFDVRRVNGIVLAAMGLPLPPELAAPDPPSA
ncbi:MAG: glycosyltransferase family 4 protein [Verrucomicrobiales bacterium]|nr:glycosyltransferase family 4 protein [Verrucomicrobiales bacterium]